MRKLIESYNNGYGPGNGGNGNGAPGSGNNGGNGNNSNGGSGNGSPKRPSILMLILSGLMTVIVVLMLYNAFFGTNTGTEVSYTDFLKDLEADELVQRIQYNEIPLRVEYSLTLKGQDLLPVFYAIMQWGIKYIP